MNHPFIVDSHVHTGFPNLFFSPEIDTTSLLKRMDQFQIQYAINLCSMRTLTGHQAEELKKARKEYTESKGRIFYLGFYDPRRGKEDLAVLEKAIRWPGFKGIKIHPSFNKTPADNDAYGPVWQFAFEHDLPIVTHSWSVSSYNPVQVLSTPEKCERFVQKYPDVRLVLGHAGGRGEGRYEAVRMAKKYKHVYMDFSGDIYDYHFFEKMAVEIPENKILFGTDYPWFDYRSQLTRVYLAHIHTSFKKKILRYNALEVYRLETI
jgi:predicted TIM-barrel fold metal-dependent hydrolase